MFRSPLRYPGGKACIFKFMTKLLEKNDLVGIDYAEPYVGGAGLALKLLMDEYVNELFINDLDPSIYSLWYAILNYPNELCSWIEMVKVDVQQWLYYKNVQRNYKVADALELAKSTFFLNRTNVSGVISGGPIGGMSQKGKYKIDVRFNKEDLVARIEDISQFAHRIHLSNQNGVDFVDAIEQKCAHVFMYLDPPYYQKGADLYLNAFKDADHKILAEKVKKMRALWMVSYDYHEFVLNLYKGKSKVRYRLSQCASNRVGDEVVIFDDRLKFSEAVNELNSPVVL